MSILNQASENTSDFRLEIRNYLITYNSNIFIFKIKILGISKFLVRNIHKIETCMTTNAKNIS